MPEQVQTPAAEPVAPVTVTAEPVVSETITPVVQESAEPVDELKVQLARVEKALKDANKESAQRRKRLDELEQAESERAKAAMSETDRLKAEVAEAKQKAAEAIAEQERVKSEAASQSLKTQILLRASALDFANPEDAYALLDLAELKADEPKTIDDALVKLEGRLPKRAQAKQAPKVSPTNPSGATSEGMTDDQLRAEIFGRGMGSPFTPEVLKAKGGGVFWNTKALQ